MASPSTTRSVSLQTAVIFSSLMLLAALFRLPQLPARPMHSDEAINADRLGVLLEHGEYKYSAIDYHGPTLTYLSWPVAKALGITRYVDLSETTLRLIPALAGILLVALHIFLVRNIGLISSAMAALLTAISPAMVYYSRYYIHEMLLVVFSFAALLAVIRFWERRRTAWGATVGVCIGLMFATKETAIIPVTCVALAAAAVAGMRIQRGQRLSNLRSLSKYLAVMLAATIFTIVLLVSSFFTNPRGMVDFILAFHGYFLRGLGVGTSHVYPWTYYLHLMNYYRADGGRLFTEAVTTILALIGLIAVVRSGAKGRNSSPHQSFLAVYTLTMIAAYSVLPYKVPWNFLGPMHAMILLGGIGVATLANACKNRAQRIVVAALLLAGAAHLGWQAWRDSIPLASDPANPWVYAHTSKDVFTILQKVELLASSYPGGRSKLPIAIVSRENLWPLPWYLRRYPQVQWWNGVSVTAPSAPVYLITPDMEPALTRRLYHVPPPGQRDLYQNLFDRPVELRPGVELHGFASMSVWEGL